MSAIGDRVKLVEAAVAKGAANASGGIAGTITANAILKATGPTTVGDSSLTDNSGALHGTGSLQIDGNYSGGNTAVFHGSVLGADNSGVGTATEMDAVYVPPLANSGTITNYIGIKVADLAGAGSSTSYAFWYDGRGVVRIRDDPTLGSVPAIYNNLFTKYTPGATDYERIVQQWNTNVAEIGPEAGGTGTLWPLRLKGSAVWVGDGTNGPIPQVSLYGGTDGNSGPLLYFQAGPVDSGSSIGQISSAHYLGVGSNDNQLIVSGYSPGGVGFSSDAQNVQLSIDGTTRLVTINTELVLANQTSTPGSAAGTLTNAPHSGDPQTWLKVSINGVDHFIPAWHT